jgi:hypothetical protein
MTHPMEGHAPTVIRHKSWNGWSNDVLWEANLIVHAGPGVGYEFGESTANRFVGNAYAGVLPASMPADPEALRLDPGLQASTPARLDRAAVIEAFTPAADSPVRGRVPARDGQARLDFAGRAAAFPDGSATPGALAPAVPLPGAP